MLAVAIPVTDIYYVVLPRSMWDVEPILYWRVRQNGKLSWQKANAVQVQAMQYVISPPKLKVVESGDESE